jgi:hypothetical protein
MSSGRVCLLALASALFVSREAWATCFDRVRDGQESDVDCGGDCVPCERGDACRVPHDCYSGRCAESVCEERVYPKGTTIPPGYRVELSTADGGAITRTIGWISLGVGYGIAYASALALPGAESWLYAPVVGPWVVVAKPDQSLRGLIAVDGLLQTVGAGLVIGGIATGGKQLVRDEGVLAHLLLTPGPMGGRDGYGLWARGAF